MTEFKTEIEKIFNRLDISYRFEGGMGIAERLPKRITDNLIIELISLFNKHIEGKKGELFELFEYDLDQIGTDGIDDIINILKIRE